MKEPLKAEPLSEERSSITGSQSNLQRTRLLSPAQSEIDKMTFYCAPEMSLDPDLLKNAPPRWKRYVVLASCVLIHLSLGNNLSFGNVSPYFASYQTYLAWLSNPEIDLPVVYQQHVTACQYIFACSVTCSSLGSLAGGRIEKLLGPRLTVMAACLLMLTGTGTTYFTCGSLFGSILTYGILFGFGIGVAYGVLLVVAVRWFPVDQGAITGLVLAAYGCGAMVFETVQTHFVNPDNSPVSAIDGYMGYQTVLDRVPYMFLLLATCFCVMQCISVGWISYPPSDYLKMEIARFGAKGQAGSKASMSLIKYASSQSFLAWGPKDVCASFRFWHIELISFLSFVAMLFAVQSWKLFSVEYIGITDDNFLASLGALGAFLSGVGRLGWGWIFDKLDRNFQAAMLLMAGIQTVVMLTFPLLPMLGGDNQTTLKILLYIWVSLMFLCNGYFSFIPSTMSALFGEKNATQFVGFVLVMQIPATFLVSFLCGNVDKLGGWGYGMIYLGCVCGGSWLLTLLFSPRQRGITTSSRQRLKSVCFGFCHCLERLLSCGKMRTIMSPTMSRGISGGFSANKQPSVEKSGGLTPVTPPSQNAVIPISPAAGAVTENEPLIAGTASSRSHADRTPNYQAVTTQNVRLLKK